MAYSALLPPIQRGAKFANKRRWKRKKIKLLSALITAGFVLFVLFLISTAIVFGYFAREIPAPDRLTSRAIEQSTRIYDRSGVLLYNIHGDENRTLVTLDKIPQNLRDATIATEDKNFYKHKGFDVTGYFRSVKDLVFQKRLIGGSTLTQQLVKNTLLTRERTVTRKIKEFILSVQIERRYTKDQILQIYLNEIPYGGTAWGVEAAANQYFGKHVWQLNLVQSAILAGLPQSPSVYSPFGPDPKAYIGRTQVVLGLMRQDGYITGDQEQKALKQLPHVKFANFGEGILAPHFSLFVKQQLEEKYGVRLVEEGGLQVTTTLDLKLQNMAQKAVADNIKTTGKALRMSNGAAMIENTKTGEILAMVGSKNYFAKDIPGNFNVATQGLRQPGSALKPFNYVTGFEKGYNPATMFLDLKTNFGGGYSPGNYCDCFNGPLSVRVALASSFNVPAVKMLAVNGLSNVLDTLRDFGITTLDDPNKYGLSLTLGGGAIKLHELTNAYAILGNEGKKVSPVTVLKVKDANGKVLEQFNPGDFVKNNNDQVVTPEYAYLIDNILSDPTAKYLSYGSYWANKLNFRKGIAVKTGTSEEKVDNWVFGFTNSYVVGTWVGNNDNTPMDPSVSSGITGAAPIYTNIMGQLLAGKKVTDFNRPSGIINAKVNALTGQKPVPGVRTKYEIFTKWQPPPEDDMHVKVTICKPSGLIANESCKNAGLAVTKTYFVLTDPYTRLFQPYFKYCKPCPPTKKDTRIYSPNGPEGDLVVKITKPEDGANVGSKDFTVKATASGPNPIDRVEFYFYGSATPDAVDTSPPYGASFFDVAPGDYTIKAIVYDSEGNSSEDAISLTVAGGTPLGPPISKKLLDSSVVPNYWRRYNLYA